MSARIFLARAFRDGETLALPPAESRHLQVRRLQPGASVTLFNGDDGLEWRAAITRIGRSDVELRIDGSSLPPLRELPIAVTLALGVPANERMDNVVEKATELGVAAIQPLLCERSVVRLSGERAEARRRHWQAVAASASEQCGRVRVPRIDLPMPFGAWLARRCIDPAGAGTGRRGARVAEPVAQQPDRRAVIDPSKAEAEQHGPDRRFVLSLDSAALPCDTLVAAATPPLDSMLVLSGPEGGLADDEEASAVAAGFTRVSLGPRILRADTAAVAALALIQTHFGDWQ